MALPLMVRAMRLSIEAVDRRLEAAAWTLGAGRWRVFRTITLPLSLPGMIAGTVLGFARSLGEFGATITFVSNVPGETQTLPLAIYAALQRPDGEAMVLRLSALSVAALAGGTGRVRADRAASGRGCACPLTSMSASGSATTRSRAVRGGRGLTVLFGPSGAGKTSVLNMVAGLLRPDRGHVRVGGETLFDARDRRAARTPPRRLCVPGVPPVPAPAGRGESALRRRTRRVGRSIATSSASRICSIAGRARSRAARRGAWRSGAPCSASRVPAARRTLASLDRARAREIVRVIGDCATSWAADPDGHSRSRGSRTARRRGSSIWRGSL